METGRVSALLSIGEFSRLTHVSVKALRHYHDVGLLEPAEVDTMTGRRFYSTAQVPAALVIRRFRDLDMPLDEVREVLRAPDVAARDHAIVAHLERMERRLEQTQATVTSLRGLLDGTEARVAVEYRDTPSAETIAIRERVEWDATEEWLAAALAELEAARHDGGLARAGPDGALYSAEYFQAHEGEVIAFVPVLGVRTATGRVECLDIAAGLFAVTVHEGAFGDLDQVYGALGTFVAERAIGAEGPIRENYVEGEGAALRTEVCWPVTTRA
jgi:DNA-binding transcriptional MerR regulator